MSGLPFLRNISRPLAILNKEITTHFADAFLPDTTPEQRRDPSISPFFADLYSMKLPPAIFLCGTDDCLLEDTVLMATRWQLAGGETMMRLFPGAPHGFIIAPPDVSENAKEGFGLLRPSSYDIQFDLTKRFAKQYDHHIINAERNLAPSHISFDVCLLHLLRPCPDT